MARPDLGDRIRACPHGRYIIFFQLQASDAPILIARVLHSARDLVPLFRDDV